MAADGSEPGPLRRGRFPPPLAGEARERGTRGGSHREKSNTRNEHFFLGRPLSPPSP